MKKYLWTMGTAGAALVCVFAFQNCESQTAFSVAESLDLGSRQGEANYDDSLTARIDLVNDGVQDPITAEQMYEEVARAESIPNLPRCAVSAPRSVEFGKSVNVRINLSSYLDRDARIHIRGHRAYAGISEHSWGFSTRGGVSRGATSINTNSQLFKTSRMPGDTTVLVQLVDYQGNYICAPSVVMVEEKPAKCTLTHINPKSGAYVEGEAVILCLDIKNEDQTITPWGYNGGEVYGMLNGVDNISANIASGLIPNRYFTSKQMNPNPPQHPQGRCYKFDVTAATGRGAHERFMKFVYIYDNQVTIPICESNKVTYSVR